MSWAGPLPHNPGLRAGTGDNKKPAENKKTGQAKEPADPAERPTRIDPVDAMLNVVEGFETFVNRSRQSEGRSLRYRANLLWVHSLAAMTMAPLFVGTGRASMQASPNFRFLLLLPGAPLSVALLLGAGGLVLGLGCVLGVRRLEIIGLIGLALFYLTLSVSFALAGITFYLHDLPGPKPAIYSPVLYLHMTIIMAVHMSTLLRARWRERVT